MKAPGEKLLIKLWETLSEKGIGSLLSPWHIRRMGQANSDVRVQELLALTQAEKYAEEIRCGRMKFKKGQLINVSPDERKFFPEKENKPQLDYRAIAQAVNKNIYTDAIRHEVNVGKALLHAEEVLEQDPQEPSEKNIDEDWLYRWRDYASSVSSEKLQSIWGKLLAGEIKTPGSFSLRTLDFLKSISQEDAESITKLLRFSIGGVIFRGDEELLGNDGIKFDFLLEMQQLGVISGVEALSLTTTFGSTEKNKFVLALTSHGKVLIAKHDDPTKKLTLSPICKISTIGQQILHLGKFEPHDKYLRKIGEIMKTQGFEVELASYVKVNDRMIHYVIPEKL